MLLFPLGNVSLSKSNLCVETELAGSLCPSAEGHAVGTLEARLHVLHQAEQEDNAGFLLGRRVALPGRERHICGCCKAVSIPRNTDI